MHPRSIFALALALASGVALAQAYQAADLRITHPHARPTVAHQPTGAAYVTIENTGKTEDRLVAASTPVAKSVEIHTMTMEGNVMKMREAGAIDLKPAATVTMQPGHGYHLILFGLNRSLKAGDQFPMTLTFEKAGKAEVTVKVENNAAAGGMQKMH